MPFPETELRACQFCSVDQICRDGCSWPDCLHDDRSPPSPAGAVETLAAPAAPVTGENTRHEHNYLQWLHVVLFLGLDVQPRRRTRP
ncbi:hypothetical protein J2X09_003274 [Hydrogenophaga laconesensis]|uniref:Uncharacterized protein n=1 Tax=Hydrogenophaga laconesensis TaxID=1805971 RepID=A0ABU1VDG6_9BURK|nr:hypothetical protein [Hydrogenophaga laconesensis]